MFRKCLLRVVNLLLWLSGSALLGSSGCDVSDSVLDTVALAFGIVDVWT